MKTADSIKDIIFEQINGYLSLLDILRREKECLINFDAAAVEHISKEKDTAVLRLRLLEEERIRLASRLGRDKKIEGDISLQKIYELTGDTDFQMLRLQMISLTQGISEINQFNRILIEHSMHFVRNAANFLGSFGLKGLERGAVLSREA